MKRNKFPFVIFLLVLMMPLVQSCEVVGDIFGAGMWVGIFIVLIIIVVILWLFGKARR